MPLYEYECEACSERFEVIRKFSDPPLEVCTKCGHGPIRRLPSSPAIQFKGTGWYITDYAQKGKSEGKSEGKSDKSGSSAHKDSKKDAGASGDDTASTSASESKSSTTESSSTSPAPSAPSKTGGTSKD